MGDRQIKHLWGAVLCRAVEDLSSTNGLQVMSATDWFNNLENIGTGSLAWVCEVLELDPVAVRTKALNRPQTSGTVR